jgi:hypothetical protein
VVAVLDQAQAGCEARHTTPTLTRRTAKMHLNNNAAVAVQILIRRSPSDGPLRMSFAQINETGSSLHQRHGRGSRCDLADVELSCLAVAGCG